MRLDIYLYERKMASSRTEAKNFILSGAVTVDGAQINKPSYEVSDGAQIDLDKSGKKFVSRGGVKLEAALDDFKIDVSGALALDIGASSGGFTDCLLSRGATHVIAVDSGSAQLNPALKEDARVTSIEGYNARYMSRADFEYIPNLAVMDVSFISATLIIPAVYNVLSSDGKFICLIKPQFEVGRANIGKGGIVKNDKARNLALKNVIEFAEAIGFRLVDYKTSPILGGDGNIEYLAYFLKSEI